MPKVVSLRRRRAQQAPHEDLRGASLQSNGGFFMSQVQAQRLTRTIGTLQIVILALVAITALVHLRLGIGMSLGGFGARGPGGPPPGGTPRPQGGPPGGFNMFQYLPLPLPIL